MTNRNYKIFISYRHDDTADKAEHLLSLLEASGYKGLVSFDRENLDGRFDLEIMRRLDACTDFIAIIGTSTLVNIKKEINFGVNPTKYNTCIKSYLSNNNTSYTTNYSVKMNFNNT